MSSYDQNNVCQQFQNRMIQDVVNVIESWKNAETWIERLKEAIESHRQSRIAFLNAEKELLDPDRPLWESFRETFISYFPGPNKVEDPVKMAEKNRLKDLVEECAKKVDSKSNCIRFVLKELAFAVAKANYTTCTWIESIREHLLSEIRASVVPTTITCWDLLKLLGSPRYEFFGELYEAASLYQRAYDSEIQWISTTKETRINPMQIDFEARRNLFDMYQLLVVSVKIWEKATQINRLLPTNPMDLTHVNRLIPGTSLVDFKCRRMDVASPYYKGISCDNIQPFITEILKEAEEAAKLFSPSSDKSDTQTKSKKL
jgi:hypothetical protein